MYASRCFICSEPGHKSFQCPVKYLNKKKYLAKAETSASSFRSRSRSPVRCSKDDEDSTHSADDTSLTENNSNTKLDFKTSVYIGNLPKDWECSKIKNFIIANVEQADSKNIFVIALKDKNLKESGFFKIKVDKEIANTMVETLANTMCDGKKLLATLDSDAPFLNNLLVTQHSVRRAKEVLQWRKYNRNRTIEVQNSENKFEINKIKDNSDDNNLYGLSRNFLNALDVTPPLRNSIFVANFDCEKVNQEKLREIFSLAGQVVSVYIFRNSDGTPKKCAKVTFDHPIEAVQAISMFHNQTLYDQYLTIKMDNTPKHFTPVLPDGIKKTGPGLGPNGKPMRSVRNTIEWEPLKHLLLKELSKLKNDSVSNLEESISPHSFFHQNVPVMPNYAMGGAEQMAINPMALNSVINQMAQNAAMNIMSRTPGINPMAQNATVNSVAQNATINPMNQNAAMNPMAPNAAMNPMAPNAAMNPMAQNAAMNGQWAVAQNVDPNLMTRNNLNLMAQNSNMMGMNAMNNPTQSDMQPPNMMANMQGYQPQVVTNAQNRGEWNLGAAGYVGISSGASQQSYNDNRLNQGDVAQREYIPSDVTESRGRGNSDRKDNTGDNRSHMLLFTNLPYSVNQESLTSKMREIGKLKFIELTGQGRAIMSFEKYTDAERCINLFHRCKVDGQIIEVKFF